MAAGPRRYSLSWLVTFYLAAALLLLSVVLGIALQRSVAQFLESALRDKAEALANQLAVVTLDAVLSRDYGTIERYVSALVGRQDVLFIQISRHDGAVLGRAGALAPDQPVVRHALTLLGRPQGEVAVQYDTTRVREVIFRITLALAAGVLVLTAAFFFLLRRALERSIIAPIRRLAAQVNPALAGEVRPIEGAPREVAELAETLDALQARISHHLQELEQAHRSHNEAIRRLCSDQRLATMGQMAAELAHEMNTPLSNILGYAQTALARAEDPELRRRLEVIAEHARRLTQIVRDMMSAVRPPAPVGGRVDLAALLESIARLAQPMLGRHDARIDIEAPPGAACWADVTMTEQILFNLLSNAVQAGAHRVAFRAFEAGNEVCVSVADDGTGIRESIRERLFEPFVTTKDRGEGTGLGLSISQRLAQEMGGRLELVASRPGHTEFRLRLPARAGAARESA